MTDLPHLITRRDLSICSPTIRRLPRRLAGRMAHAYIAETPGVYQPAWTIEDVARRLGEIADRSHPVAFAPVPRGFYDHLGYSFDMARDGPGKP
jgi:hypothetical protein